MAAATRAIALHGHGRTKRPAIAARSSIDAEDDGRPTGIDSPRGG
jgi:hypothetical protein